MDNAQMNHTQAMTFHTPDKKGITGSTIKLIAIVAMFIDHIGATIFERMLMYRGFGIANMNPELMNNWLKIGNNALIFMSYTVMRLIGRFGFPIFCFLLVEGFIHTRSKAKYALRLFLFCLISELPFDLAFSGRWYYPYYQNVFFTLLIGFVAMCAFDYLKTHFLTGIPTVLFRIVSLLLPSYYASTALTNLTYDSIFVEFHGFLSSPYMLLGIFWVLLAPVTALVLRKRSIVYGRDHAQTLCADLVVLTVAMYVAELLQTDYAGMGVLTICLMYAFRSNKIKSMLAGCITLTVMSLMEITAFLMLIPISKYNGKRGLNIKYFFYAFYPVHLALLYLICKLMGLA